ncbi:7-deoxyloganetin glucosyltransferase-like [Carya illinoinensis]|uniref:7-deoxyloganetin glucosyltransferase-like n=1 Tax=Carya illinoinensis TaxID=32201 RepID=UPI001C71AFD1|nr:7-deoxyloganetin glucosyltransferase-like [Carya illinoinensis]
MSSVEEKPHAVCIPFPTQGHVNPMLKLAKVLHHRGFRITFINTEFNHRRLLKARGPDSLDGLPDFCFETIPDGLPSSDADATQDILSLCDSIAKNFMVPFRNRLAELNDTVSSNVPPVSCIVSDLNMHFANTVAEELGIPILLLCPVSAFFFLSIAHTRRLAVESGLLIPPKDVSHLPNGYMDTTIDWISGMKNIRIKDLSSVIFESDSKGIMLNFILEIVEKASKASAIVVNTFDALEHEGLDALSSLFPPIYSIGPLHLLLSQIPQNNSKLNNISSNLWKDEADCLEWLNSKEPNSVIYVNFGSIAVLTPPQIVEFAYGLANSKKAFLWVIRPDMVKDDSVIVTHEFLSETKDRGIVVSWCPQEHVLSHPSIGGFLTHCGWNSMIESMCVGVPMLCWPFGGDQKTNCRFACVEWGLGIEIDCNVKRDEVEKLVRELMEGDKGKEMKKHATKWQKMAKEAVGTNGSSTLNLDKVVKEVLLH